MSAADYMGGWSVSGTTLLQTSAGHILEALKCNIGIYSKISEFWQQLQS